MTKIMPRRKGNISEFFTLKYDLTWYKIPQITSLPLSIAEL